MNAIIELALPGRGVRARLRAGAGLWGLALPRELSRGIFAGLAGGRARPGVALDGRDISALPAHERSRRGLFVGSGELPRLPGVTVGRLLRAALRARSGRWAGLRESRRLLEDSAAALGLGAVVLERGLGGRFSAADRRLCELLAVAVLAPRAALLLDPGSRLGSGDAARVRRGLKRCATGRAVVVLAPARRLRELGVDRGWRIAGGRLARL